MNDSRLPHLSRVGEICTVNLKPCTTLPPSVWLQGFPRYEHAACLDRSNEEGNATAVLPARNVGGHESHGRAACRPATSSANEGCNTFSPSTAACGAAAAAVLRVVDDSSAVSRPPTSWSIVWAPTARVVTRVVPVCTRTMNVKATRSNTSPRGHPAAPPRCCTLRHPPRCCTLRHIFSEVFGSRGWRCRGGGIIAALQPLVARAPRAAACRLLQAGRGCAGLGE